MIYDSKGKSMGTRAYNPPEIGELFINMVRNKIENNPTEYNQKNWYQDFYVTALGFQTAKDLKDFSEQEFEVTKRDWAMYKAPNLVKEAFLQIGIEFHNTNSDLYKAVESLAKEELYNHIDCTKQEMINRLNGYEKQFNPYDSMPYAAVRNPEFKATLNILDTHGGDMVAKFMEKEGWYKEREEAFDNLMMSGKSFIFSKNFNDTVQMQEEMDFVTKTCASMHLLNEEINKDAETVSNPFIGFDLQ